MSARGEARPTTTTDTGRLPDDYFTDVWSESDPWGFEDRWYERRKRDLVLAALPAERFAHAFEPGCAQGLLTARLARRCDRVTAMEPVAHVAERARQRCRDLPQVGVRTGALPDDWPTDEIGFGASEFDLVMASEVLYYLEPMALDVVLEGFAASLRSGGALVAVHWRGPTDYPLSGDEVHDRLDECRWLAPTLHLQEDALLLDVWARR